MSKESARNSNADVCCSPSILFESKNFNNERKVLVSWDDLLITISIKLAEYSRDFCTWWS